MTMTKPTSEQVTFTAAGSGATLRNLVDKVRESVSAADFGAVGDGVTNDTAALKAAFDYAVPAKRTVVLRGSYLVNGPITPQTVLASGDLNIICDGAVSITVDAGAAPFSSLFQLYTLAAHTMSITGGSLLIDLNQRCAIGFYVRYNTLQDGGIINITTPVTIRDAFAQSGVTQEAGGFRAFGAALAPWGYGYTSVLIDGMRVENVGRNSDGVCTGISVAYYTGEVCIRNCYVSNVLRAGVSAFADADGIAVAGAFRGVSGDATMTRLGKSVISDCTIVDCQGRSFKSQCSRCTVIRPRVYRKDVVGSTSCTDFDFQTGNGTIIDPHFQYMLDGSTSPLPANHIPVAFRNWVDDEQSSATCINAVMLTEVQCPRLVSAQYETYSLASSIVVANAVFLPSGPLVGTTTPILTRGIVEISETEKIATSGAIAAISVRNCSGQFASDCICYTGYSGGSIAALLRPEVIGNHSTVQGTNNHCFRRISDSIIVALDWFVFRDNHNVSAMLSNFSGMLRDLDMTKIAVGNSIILDLDSIIAGGGSVTGAPPWDSGTDAMATVEVLAQGLSTTLNSKLIRVVNTTTPSGTPKRSQVFVSADNAASWIREDDASPVTVTSDSTVGAWQSAVINNKSGSACVLTLPSPSANEGRRMMVKTIQAQAVDSASSNVVPLAGGAAGTSILTNTAGKWAEIISDGTNWVIMASN